MANPKLKAYNVVRTHLMGGLFEALRENRRRPMPQRMFEIDNVVALNDSAETGAAEERRMAFVETGRESGYATARSVMDALLRELGWTGEYMAIKDPTFVDGRVAAFKMGDKPIAVLGEVHPEVLSQLRPHAPSRARRNHAPTRVLNEHTSPASRQVHPADLAAAMPGRLRRVHGNCVVNVWSAMIIG